MMKWVVVVLTLTQTHIGCLKCELEKYDEFEEIVNYFRLRDYTLGGDFEGYLFPPDSISDFSTLLKEKLNCEYDSLETLLFTAFRHCAFSRDQLNQISNKLFDEVIDENSCRLNANFSETRFNYAEPFMEEMLQKEDKLITNYLSFQSALDNLKTIFLEFIYVYENHDEVKYIKNLTDTIKQRSQDSHQSIEQEIHKISQGNNQVKKWTRNRFLKHLLRCYIRSENVLHPEQDEKEQDVKPSPETPVIAPPKSKFYLIFLIAFATVFFGPLCIGLLIYWKKPSLIIKS